MTTAKVIRRAIRDVDGLNAEAARQLESAIMSRYVYDQSMTIDHLDDIMGVVDEVLSPVYGRDRVRAARSSMFQAIVRNGQIAADESYLRPFHEMDIRLYERFGDDWSRIRSRMIRQKGYFPNALAAIGGDQKAVRRLNLRRKKLFDPQRRWVDPRGYRLSDRIWKQGVLHRRNIDKVLKRGIKRGDGPVTIAKELREYLDPAAAPLSFRRDGRILRRKRARGRFRDGQGASAARRLARTEVQRVAHDATVQSVRDLREDIPRAAVIYALSPAHPKIDICDSYADGSSRGYPPGVYLPDEVPSIPHPNCLCSRRPWVPSREEVLRDLEKKYGTRSPRARIISDDEWEYRGDGVYEWDATQWGDDVGWEKGFNDALDLGMSEEQAYRLAYEDAKNGYFTQRSDDLNEFFGFHYDDGSGWPLVTVDGDGVRDLWRMSANDLADRVADPRIRTDWGIVDDTIDEAITNSRRSINFLMENMEDWDDLAPSFELTGGRKIGSAAADYGLDSNTIRINLTDRSWFGRDLPLDDGVPSGYVHRFTVAESPEGFLVHEYGHTRHMTDLQRHGMIDWVQDWDDPSKWYYRMTDWDGVVREFGEDSLWDGWETAKERLIATRVSNYAAYDPLEFVAETHTALIQGERFGDDVMDLYRQLGGKIPAQSEIDNWALAAGREVDYSDDAFDFADDLFDDGEVWDRLGISQSDYDDLVERGIKQGAITDVDLFDDMTDDVDFMRRVMGDLDGPPRPEPRAKLRSLPEEPWERSGDGNDYDWDTTNWGDSVAFRKEFDRINDRNERLLASGDDIEEWEIQWDAYGSAYKNAKNEYLRERKRDVTEWFDHRAGGDASISFGGHHDMVDFWSRTDDEMDRYFNNVFDGTSVIRNLDGFPSDRLNVDIDIADLRRRGYDDVDIGSVIDSNKVFRIKPSQYGESGSHSGGLMRDDWGSISISDKWDELFVRDMKVSPSPDYLREMVSGESPPLMLVHEFGHGLHKANLKTFANPKSHGNPLDGTMYIEITARDGRRIRLGYGGARTSELYPEKAGAILREVSRYADSDPMEFVAETYTGLLTGERYSDEVMELFDLLGGVEPSLKDRQLWREFERARRKSGYNEVDRDRRTPARNVDPQVDPSDENPYDDWAGDDVFPDTSGMTEEEVANMMGWTSEEFDDVIYYGIDRDLFDDDDIIVFDEFEVLGEWEGIPPAPILQMVKDIMELEENSAGKRWWE